MSRDDPAVAASLGFLAANLAMRHERQEEAHSARSRALSNLDRSAEPDRRFAPVLRFAADLEQRGGRYDEAIALYRRCLAIPERVLPAAHPDRGMCWNNLGSALWLAGRGREAYAAWRRGLENWEVAFGPDHPATANALTNVARGLAPIEGDPLGAVALLRANSSHAMLVKAVNVKPAPVVAIDPTQQPGVVPSPAYVMPTPAMLPSRTLPQGEMSSCAEFNRRYGLGGGGKDSLISRYQQQVAPPPPVAVAPPTAPGASRSGLHPMLDERQLEVTSR